MMTPGEGPGDGVRQIGIENKGASEAVLEGDDSLRRVLRGENGRAYLVTMSEKGDRWRFPCFLASMLMDGSFVWTDTSN